MPNSKAQIVKRTLTVLLVGLIVIQFIRPAPNANAEINANDITRNYMVPDSVQTILKRACYDCHSNYTVYPWYSKIQPVAFWMNDHIKEGKGHLNFSEFNTYTPEKKAKKLHGVAKVIDEGEMPLESYLWIHKDAKLTNTQKMLVEQWAEGLSKQIAAQK